MDLTHMHRKALVERLLAPDVGASVHRTGEACAASATSRADRVRELLDVARELLLRDMRRDWQNLPLMDGPGPFREWLRLHCSALEHEVFIVVFLNAHHRIIGVQELFRGSLSQTSVYPREVVKAALAHNAAAIAIAHNRPSGDPEPSRADECLTTVLKSALALVDVRCLDHFIVAGDRLVSFSERGLM
jgi:DNA repair protein RadC